MDEDTSEGEEVLARLQALDDRLEALVEIIDGYRDRVDMQFGALQTTLLATLKSQGRTLPITVEGLSRELSDDELYPTARAAVIEAGKASTSYLQRRLGCGYSRAAKLIDMLEENGVIGPPDGAKPREVLVADDPVASANIFMSTDEIDEALYERARELVIETNNASTSLLQRILGIGYAKAAALLDLLEERDVIGPADGSKPREVIAQRPKDDI